MPERPLDDAEINRLVLTQDVDLVQVAMWTHLLQDKVTSGEIVLPVESMEQLEPLFALGETTPIPSPLVAGRTYLPQRPGAEYIPPAMFPIRDLGDFVRKATGVLRLVHTIRGPYVPYKLH